MQFIAISSNPQNDPANRLDLENSSERWPIWWNDEENDGSHKVYLDGSNLFWFVVVNINRAS